MGAWDVGSFANDDALDWVGALDSDDDGAVLREAFDRVQGQTEPGVGAFRACEALAAAEVVAAALGAPVDDAPEEVGAWVSRNREVVDDGLRTRALDAVRFVREQSELRVLWDEEDPTDWLEAVDDLASRLSSGISAAS
jgi:hypothetical protein